MNLSTKRRFLTLLLVICLVFGNFMTAFAEGEYAEPVLDNGPDINVASAIVIDINSGAILYSKDATKKIQPSSLTKLVTAIIALENLDQTGKISISVTAAGQDFKTASNVGLNSGSTISASDAINGMLCISAEDCTIALAEKIGGDESSFTTMMNEWAEKEGLTGSHFSNSSGRADASNYSCTYDLGLVATKLMREHRAEIPAIFANSYTLSSCDKTINNTHRFMNGTEPIKEVYAGKTGGSAYGGDGSWAMCTYASKDNLNLVCIIAGAPELSNAYEATKSLINYSFDNYESCAASSLTTVDNSNIGILFNDCPMFTLNNNNSLSTDNISAITLPKGADFSLVTREINVSSPAHFIYGNNKIGTITYTYNSKPVGSCNIYYYTERASMNEVEFNNAFPDYLIHPDDIGLPAPIIYGSNEKPTLGNKIKRGFYNIYTPAKLYSLLFAIACFGVGTLLIILIFPVRKKAVYDKLYKKSIATAREEVLPDDELSNVTRIRKTDNADMQEISLYDSDQD